MVASNVSPTYTHMPPLLLSQSVFPSLECRLTGDFASSRPSSSEAAFTEPSCHAIRQFRLSCWRQRTCREAKRMRRIIFHIQRESTGWNCIHQLTVLRPQKYAGEAILYFPAQPLQPHEWSHHFIIFMFHHMKHNHHLTHRIIINNKLLF